MAGTGCWQHAALLAARSRAAEARAATRRERVPSPLQADHEAAPISDRQVADIVASLSAHGVKYVVIGGVAAQLHGAPVGRTSDADVCALRSPENLDRLAAALRSMGARLRTLDAPPEGVEIPLDRRTFDRRVTITFVTDHGPFDVSFMPDGTAGYRDLSRNAVIIEILGVEAPVASLKDVVRSKRAAGREKDLRVLPALVRYLRSREA